MEYRLRHSLRRSTKVIRRKITYSNKVLRIPTKRGRVASQKLIGFTSKFQILSKFVMSLSLKKWTVILSKVDRFHLKISDPLKICDVTFPQKWTVILSKVDRFHLTPFLRPPPRPRALPYLAHASGSPASCMSSPRRTLKGNPGVVSVLIFHSPNALHRRQRLIA
jgi:hypothetical protein